MQKNLQSDSFNISKTFVLEKMQSLDAITLQVYLYAKCIASENDGKTTCEALYEAFGEKESVQQALRTLVRNSCLLVDCASNITFSQRTEEDKPRYTPAEINKSVERDDDLRMLMQAAECLLGKMLTASSAEVLISMYDWLGLPSDVILKLIEYCAENGKRNMAYIEKIAIAWSKEGIVTMEAAEQYIANETKRKGYFFRAKKIFGIENRSFTTREEGFLRAWQGLGVSEQLLAFAFDYTVDKTGKLSFAYMDKVLRAWIETGVKTPAQAQKFLEAYKKQQIPQKTTGASKKPGIYNTNNYDYDEIRRAARESIRRKIGKE